MDNARRFCGPVALGAVVETVIEVPADTQWILRNIHVVNTDPVTEALFTLSLGTDDPAARFFHTVVPAYGVLDWSGFMVLNAGEFMQAAAQTGAVVLNAAGVEVTP